MSAFGQLPMGEERYGPCIHVRLFVWDCEGPGVVLGHVVNFKIKDRIGQRDGGVSKAQCICEGIAVRWCRVLGVGTRGGEDAKLQFEFVEWTER
jgi:hypothetical protein